MIEWVIVGIVVAALAWIISRFAEALEAQRARPSKPTHPLPPEIPFSVVEPDRRVTVGNIPNWDEGAHRLIRELRAEWEHRKLIHRSTMHDVAGVIAQVDDLLAEAPDQ